MPGTEFSLGIFFIAGPLLGFSHLNFYFFWRSLFNGRGSHGRRRRSNRGSRWRSSGCCALRCCFLSHSSIPLSRSGAYFISRLPSAPYSTRIIPAEPCRSWTHCPTSTCQRTPLPKDTIPAAALSVPILFGLSTRKASVYLAAGGYSVRHPRVFLQFF